MTVSDASAAKYASHDVLAMYLHAEWGDLLTRGVRHFPGEPTCVPELMRPGHFYRKVTDLVAGWLAEGTQAPLTACDVGAGTGRNAYELAQRVTSLAEFTVVEPSMVFCDWMRRLLVETPQDLCVPTPGRVGDPDEVLVAADRLPRLPVPLRVFTTDAAAMAAARERFDLVTCFNVLDRVADPAGFAATVASLVAPGGLLVMACPFDFELQYSPRQAWVRDLREVIPQDAFDVVGVADVPYSFKAFDRRFNWYLTQVVAARRR